nr:Phage-related tail fibre protein [uncultured Mediterranean phage uvMED]
MINDNLTLTGAVSIAVNDEVVKEIPNLVVTAGKNFVSSRMKDTTKAAMSHMAVGTGTTAAAAGNTTLVTELDRNTLTSTTVTTNEIAYVCTWAAGDGTGAITEAGLFNASSGGDMLCRTVFSVVNKGSADSMTITWTITVS